MSERKLLPLDGDPLLALDGAGLRVHAQDLELAGVFTAGHGAERGGRAEQQRPPPSREAAFERRAG
jgi:hypothetical protein